MGFTGRGIAMHGVAKIALFGLLLSQKSASSRKALDRASPCSCYPINTDSHAAFRARCAFVTADRYAESVDFLRAQKMIA
jgi:hypothetical protein